MVRKEGLQISHLRFADDTILLLPNNKEIFQNVLYWSQIFKIVSGLRTNLSKCGLDEILRKKKRENALESLHINGELCYIYL